MKLGLGPLRSRQDHSVLPLPSKPTPDASATPAKVGIMVEAGRATLEKVADAPRRTRNPATLSDSTSVAGEKLRSS